VVVGPLRKFSRALAQRPRKAISHEGIDRDVAARAIRRHDPHCGQRGKVMSRRLAEAVRCEHDFDITTSRDEMAHGAQPTASVVAAAGKHRDPALGRGPHHEFGEGGSRVLHHLQERDAEHLDGEPVGFDHLLDSEPR
jgi:hypothetical protein